MHILQDKSMLRAIHLQVSIINMCLIQGFNLEILLTLPLTSSYFMNVHPFEMLQMAFFKLVLLSSYNQTLVRSNAFYNRDIIRQTKL